MEPPLPKLVIDTMAGRAHRLHHWLWHQVRNSWLSYPDDVKLKIEELGWKPPRPAFDAAGRPDLTNDAGEDFLYMHRQMIAHANSLLAEVGDPDYPRIQPWLVPPSPDDPDFQVPPAWADPLGQSLPPERLQRVKSDLFYKKRLLFWHKMFTDPGFLRGITLGELGTLIELTIHNAMHLRWATPPASSRPEPGPTEGDAIPEIYDDPGYDFLGDTYSSHVNPIFWKLHGWIDDRVEDWKTTNGVFGIDHFWKGRWEGPTAVQEVGGTMAVTAHAALDDHVHGGGLAEATAEAARVVAQAGVFHGGLAPPLSYEIW